MLTGSAAVGLSESEQALADQIVWDNEHRPHDAARTRRNGEFMLALTKSLIDRNAIPESRGRYLSDPDYNVSGRGSSRMDGFVRYGCRGDDILRHPHFLKYLRYLVFGPALPRNLIEAFAQAVNECGNVTSGDTEFLREKARSLVRSARLDPGIAAEEFYKLAIDVGLSADTANCVRIAVKQVKLVRYG